MVPYGAGTCSATGFVCTGRADVVSGRAAAPVSVIDIDPVRIGTAAVARALFRRTELGGDFRAADERIDDLHLIAGRIRLFVGGKGRGARKKEADESKKEKERKCFRRTHHGAL